MAVVLGQADLFIANGLFLEEPTIEMARANQKPGAVILTLGDKVISREEWIFDFSFPESDGHPNPHLWTSPDLALKYAQFIRDELVVLDPENAAYFEENFAKLKERIEDLDQRIASAVGHHTAAEPQAADLPRLVSILRAQVWVRDHRSSAALGLYRAFGPRGSRPGRPSTGGPSAGYIRLQVFPKPGDGADCQGGRGPVYRSTSRRRSARRPRRPATHVPGIDAGRYRNHGPGVGRQRGSLGWVRRRAGIRGCQRRQLPAGSVTLGRDRAV